MRPSGRSIRPPLRESHRRAIGKKKKAAQQAIVASVEAIADDKEHSFRAVSAQWFKEHKAHWQSTETAPKYQYVLDSFVLPLLSSVDVRSITSADAKEYLQTIFNKSPSVAKKARDTIIGTVRHAVQNRMRPDTSLDLRGIFPKRKRGHMPGIIQPGAMAELLKAIDGHTNIIVRAALKLVSLTALRPSAVTSLKWVCGAQAQRR